VTQSAGHFQRIFNQFYRSALHAAHYFRPRPHEMTQSTKLWIPKLANKLGYSEEQRRTKKKNKENNILIGKCASYNFYPRFLRAICQKVLFEPNLELSRKTTSTFA
jgi:hypothetical protein